MVSYYGCPINDIKSKNKVHLNLISQFLAGPVEYSNSDEIVHLYQSDLGRSARGSE